MSVVATPSADRTATRAASPASSASVPPSARATTPRPEVRGPFLWIGDVKLTVRGVTYGTFAADGDGHLFPPRDVVRRDFAAMNAAGVNVVRTYTPPPAWLLEEARGAGLLVMVGIYWEGRNCDYDRPELFRAATDAVRAAVRACRDHRDVVLAYCLGNEVPPLVARFHGRRTIERFLGRLCDVAREEDPGGLVTYGNYPSTEFLQLDFLDFLTVNVYLLDRAKLSAYLDRLLIEAKGRPLVLGEVGDDSIRKGEAWQASLLDWTIPLALDKGCAGVCVFSWTDDWVVGGKRVEDWGFGLVDARRQPKPALETVRRRFLESPVERRAAPWPRVSVVVCNYNGGDTLDETLTSLRRLDYPDYEVILVEDGSTDGSLAIGRRHEPHVRVIAQENRGLGAARNVGIQAATGEIVAFIDSDAFADADWLRHLVLAIESGGWAGAGGPNLTPASDGLMAQFIATCPGNPTHVLKDNVHADHVPGVNMAFRREALLAIGGFDPVHRRAGDDVDVCWKIEDAGMRLAFAPAAIVWHHRRPSISRYLKQQYGYGEAENQLEVKHPERFNLAGYIRWGGRVYLAPKRTSDTFHPFIHHGRLGTGLFQTLYQKDPSSWQDVPRTIPWYGLWALLLALSPLSVWLLPVGLFLLGGSLWCALLQGLTIEVPVRLSRLGTLRKVVVISFLHFVHPLVRSAGRAQARRNGGESRRWRLRLVWLNPLRIASEFVHLFRVGKEIRRYWGLGPAHREEFLRDVQMELRNRRVHANFGQEWDNHDLVLGSAVACVGRIHTAPEHYDQALCVGFLARTTDRASVALGVLTAACAAAALWDSRLVPVLFLPLAGVWYLLGQRTRLRTNTWDSVEAVAARRGAKRFP